MTDNIGTMIGYVINNIMFGCVSKWGVYHQVMGKYPALILIHWEWGYHAFRQTQTHVQARG